MSRLEGHSPQRALGSEQRSTGVWEQGMGGLGWRTVGAPRSGLWPGEQGVGLAPGAEPLSALGRGLGAPFPQDHPLLKQRRLGGGAHPPRKSPEQQPLVRPNPPDPQTQPGTLAPAGHPVTPCPPLFIFC